MLKEKAEELIKEEEKTRALLLIKDRLQTIKRLKEQVKTCKAEIEQLEELDFSCMESSCMMSGLQSLMSRPF